MSQFRSLKNQKEFDAVNRTGKKYVGKFFIMIISPSASPGTLLGMKVGRKFGNAVIRNKFKRRIRAIVQTYAKTNNGKAFIVIPKSFAANTTFIGLYQDFNKALSFS